MKTSLTFRNVLVLQPVSDASQKRSPFLELLLVALAILPLTGCSGGGPGASPVASAGPSAPTTNLPLLAVIGKSIADVTKEEKLTFDKKAFVIEGPNKGKPQGVKGKTAAGNEVRLYFLAGPMSGEENPKWQLDDFDAVSVTGVAVKEGSAWRQRGSVPEKLE